MFCSYISIRQNSKGKNEKILIYNRNISYQYSEYKTEFIIGGRSRTVMGPLFLYSRNKEKNTFHVLTLKM